MTRLPPFIALRAVEAAVRHRSYSRAADELAVTQSAVSHQIRRLEAELGVRLFERRGAEMIPTWEASRLAGEIGHGLDVLRTALRDFRDAPDGDPLVVSLSPQFARRWLVSGLPELLAGAGGDGVEVRVEERYVDLAAEGVDVGVRYGDGAWDGVQSLRLFKETLFPVCSPRLASDLGISRPEDLLTAPLLHGQRPWSLWFEAYGLAAPPQRGLLFDDSHMQREAAAQGLGVALARSGVVQPDLDAGRLVRPLRGDVPSGLGYFAVWRPESRKLERIKTVRDWLLAQVHETNLAA